MKKQTSKIAHNRPIFSVLQWNLNLRKSDLKKNLDLRKIVATTDFLIHKLFDLRKKFLRPNVQLKKKVEKIGTFRQF